MPCGVLVLRKCERVVSSRRGRKCALQADVQERANEQPCARGPVSARSIAARAAPAASRAAQITRRYLFILPFCTVSSSHEEHRSHQISSDLIRSHGRAHRSLSCAAPRAAAPPGVLRVYVRHEPTRKSTWQGARERTRGRAACRAVLGAGGHLGAHSLR